VLCLRHSAAEVGRRPATLRNLRKGRRALLRPILGQRTRAIEDLAEAGDPEKRRQLSAAHAAAFEKHLRDETGVRKNKGRPQSETHRRKLSRAVWLGRTLYGPPSPLHRCSEICGLVINRHQRHYYCDRVRKAYEMRWWRFHPGKEVPPPPRPPTVADSGPRGEHELARNYRWIIGLAARRTRRELLRLGGKVADPSTVSKGAETFLRLAPGKWDLIFTDVNSRRRTNRYRESLVPLRQELEPLIERGERDPLIAHLHSIHHMSVRWIAGLTGATEARVRDVIEAASSSESTPRTGAAS
jgi:hypothetical protein